MVLTIAPAPSSRRKKPNKVPKDEKRSTPARSPQTAHKKNVWKQYAEQKGSIFSSEFATIGSVLRACACSAMTTSPTSGTPASFPFVVNCKLSKVFYSVPRKCSTCNRILLFTAYACQFCSYRVHRKCANIEEDAPDCLPSPPLQRLCSLSKLPADEELFAKLIRENDINANDMDVFLEECTQLLAAHANAQAGLRHSLSARTVIWSGSSEPDTQGDWTPRSARRPRATSNRFVAPSRQYHYSESVDPSSLSDSGCHSAMAFPSSYQKGYFLPDTPGSPDAGVGPPPVVMINRLWQLFSRTQAAAAASSNKRSTMSPRATAHLDMPKTSNTSSSWAGALSSSWVCDMPSTPGAVSPTRRKTDSTATHVDSSDSGYQTGTRKTSVCSVPTRCTRSPAQSTSTSSKFNVPTTLNVTISPNHPECLETKTAPVENNSSSYFRLKTRAKTSQGSSGLITPTPVDEFNEEVISLIMSRRVSTASNAPSTMRRRKWVQKVTGDRGAQSLSQEGLVDVSAPTFCIGEPTVDSVDAAVDDSRSSEEAVKDSKQEKCGTWPFSGLHLRYDDDDQIEGVQTSDEDDVASTLTRDTLEARYSSQTSLGVSEWTLPFDDIILGDRVMNTGVMAVHKGKWHGDVLVHIYKHTGESKFDSNFLKEVQRLTKLRHENIALFMGACVESPTLAVVTGPHKGDSLFDVLHVKKRKAMSQHSKIHIARQIAQAIAYMHEKRIVLKTLSSKNVYLENKVKICIVDYAAAHTHYTSETTCAISAGWLSYLAPELLRSLSLGCLRAEVRATHTVATDAYAFGTILHEIFLNTFPLNTTHPHALIYMVATGKTEHIQQVSRQNKIPSKVRGIIKQCWSVQATQRPPFMDVYTRLTELMRMVRAGTLDETNRLHSSSVPDRLNKKSSGHHSLSRWL